ncbi:uncharacterized protein zgc:193711 [Brienomyrus brachyistius]|uniref:uncharacterized protein zgc:193711 n=1 Tax=Brienomyrus brachyistius TaxID=42636 RepID=UPI0020B1D97F|nr:uncharacterized protein zgc:193711 [Brienomyrus brachyistius]
MGNYFTKTIDRWGLNPRKVTNQSRKKKVPPEDPHRGSAETHVYDTVAEAPVYSVPKKKKKSEEEIQYAEVQVFQRQSSAGQRTLPTSTGTEYATIDFQAKHAAPSRSKSVNSATIQKTADISISPEDFLKPIPKPRLNKTSSHRLG